MATKHIELKLNPENRNHAALLNVFTQFEVMKGEKGQDGKDGYTPIKGKDYFTDQEIISIINYIQSNVKDGKDGEQGEQGKPGKDGYTPIKGKDYFTEAEKQSITKDILSKIPKQATPESIVKLVLQQVKMPDVKNLISKGELTDFLRRGGFRGGGDTIAAGDGISININENGQKEISTTGSGSFTVLTVSTGSIDDSNIVFTFSSSPTLVVVNGATYRNGSSAMGGIVSISGVTVTLPSPVGTGGDIYAIA